MRQYHACMHMHRTRNATPKCEHPVHRFPLGKRICLCGEMDVPVAPENTWNNQGSKKTGQKPKSPPGLK